MKSRIIRTILLLTAALLAVAACEQKGRPIEDSTTTSGTAGNEAADASAMPENELTVGPFHGMLPEGWRNVPPSSGMRQAEVRIPGVEGDPEGGELTVFYFGPDAGGVEANIQRWLSQFQSADGAPLAGGDVERDTFTVQAMPVTIVSFTGTMRPSTMPGAPQTGEKESWMNVSAIVETPEGPWFFKGTGPEKTMRAEMENFRWMIRNLTIRGAGAAHGTMGKKVESH